MPELPVDQSGPPTMIHRPYVPLSTSTPVHMPSDNQQTTEATEDESSFSAGDSKYITTVIIPIISGHGNFNKHIYTPINTLL